jgi:two-component system cell cycle response regulator
MGAAIRSGSDDAKALVESTSGARFLIVDDEPLQRRALAATIQEWGGIAYEASSFAEAVRLYRESDPDLVLLDVVMPRVDGYKVAQLLKHEGRFVPIIMLTGLDDLDSKRRGLAAGADEFLTKPVHPLELQIRVSSMLRIKRLADQLAAANARLSELAMTDALTGLANRRAVLDRLSHEFARAQRYRKFIACIMVDIDHFKRINDVHGHPVGDRVIANVAAALRKTIRVTDLAGRYGGEEFVIVVIETGLEGAIRLGERLRRQVARGFLDAPELPSVTISVGVATTELSVESPEALVARADQALYRAKREGRDRVVGALDP